MRRLNERKIGKYFPCLICPEFCTEWPSALDSDEKCMKHFPIQVQSKEFVSAGLSLRNPDARIVTLKVHLAVLIIK